MPSRKVISVFRKFPMELFRVNNGQVVRLREWTQTGQRRYDIISEAGKVWPKALDPKNYSAPNGASMRPNSRFQRQLVSMLRGDDVLVYSIPAGTELPEDLLLVHEHHDHYSLQPAKEMAVQELNVRITQFLAAHGRVLPKDDWLEQYSRTDSAAPDVGKVEFPRWNVPG